MEGPFLARKAYMYGNTFFEPEFPYYNIMRTHKAPVRRFYNGMPKSDNDSDYIVDDGGIHGNIPRPETKYLLTNIETNIKKILKVTLYGVEEKDDKTIEMEIGYRYAVTYMTEGGLRKADGYLRFISNSIPDDCKRYLGEYSEDITQYYIGLDCSVKGNSDKRKIYIVTIRDIEALANDEDYVIPDEFKSSTYSISNILAKLNEAVIRLDELNHNDICTSVLQKISDIDEQIKELNDIYAEDIENVNQSNDEQQTSG